MSIDPVVRKSSTFQVLTEEKKMEIQYFVTFKKSSSIVGPQKLYFLARPNKMCLNWINIFQNSFHKDKKIPNQIVIESLNKWTFFEASNACGRSFKVRPTEEEMKIEDWRLKHITRPVASLFVF